jgi:hypothetical protein
MKRFLLFVICCMVVSCPAIFAAEVNEPATTTESAPEAVATAEATPAPQEETTLQKILAKLPKVSGYLQTGWNYNSLGSHSSSFQAKRLRLIVDGNVMTNVSFRLQIEAFNGIAGSTNGNGQKNLQVMDAFATAKLSKAVNVRVGQYYLPIGYENYDISPATLETVDFSNLCYRMVCRNPIAYNFVDYGRDLGVMMFGDVLPNEAEGFNYLSYYVSLSNGSLPCKDDNNKSKDLVGAFELRPIKFLNIKAAYNWGQYAGTVNGVSYKNKDMNRVVVGAWYNDPQGLDLRTEFGHIQAGSGDNAIIKENTLYALAGYHAGKWLPVVRYDFYRDKINTATLNNYDRLLFGLTYHVTGNLKFQANYAYYMYTDKAKVTNGGEGSSSQIQIMGIFKF